jgi:hypothetical protein
MERIPSTSTVGPHDGRASAQVEHQYVRARVAQEPVCVVGPLPVRDFFSTAIPFSFLSPREKFLGYYYPFFFPHLTCKQCTMTPSFSYICPGMTLHVVLQCRTHLRPSLTGVCLLICVFLRFSAPSSFSDSLGQCEFHHPFLEKASFHHYSFLIFSGFIVAVATQHRRHVVCFIIFFGGLLFVVLARC